jgi:hypothetical protein
MFSKMIVKTDFTCLLNNYLLYTLYVFPAKFSDSKLACALYQKYFSKETTFLANIYLASRKFERWSNQGRPTQDTPTLGARYLRILSNRGKSSHQGAYPSRIQIKGQVLWKSCRSQNTMPKKKHKKK